MFIQEVRSIRIDTRGVFTWTRYLINIALVGNTGTTKKKSGEADLDLTKKGLSIG